MVEILPFSGFRYNKDIPLEKVLCLPYDVISEEEKIKFLKSHPYNFVRLTLGEKIPIDYKEINTLLIEWIKNKILIKEEKSFYIYRQKFLWYGRKEVSWGILCIMRIQPLGEEDILPHEQTFSAPKMDRLEILRKCNTNFEPIWCIYEDKEGVMSNLWKNFDEKKSLLHVETWDEREHTLWKIPSSLENLLKEFFRSKKILIADGHHRYEASWSYYQEKKEDKFAYVFTLMTDLYDPGVKVLPTHRILRKGLNISLWKLEEYFEIMEEEFKEDLDLIFNPSNPFIYYYDGRKLYKLFPKLKYLFFKNEKSNIWWVLPTTLLQKGVWEGVLKIKEGELQEKNLIRFSHSLKEVEELIKTEDFSSAFILPGIPLEIIYTLAIKGERLPQKSTYFYPKPISGLVFWKIDDEE
ncbi:MAG: DUF1015 domain-containing protein [Dictyoglomaceae bacterium]|nr:DUF1015 domain-containing protein [Dictyoglomaceae bacterium]